MAEAKRCDICQLEFGPLQARLYSQESNTVHCKGCEDVLPVQCIVTETHEEFEKVCARSKAGEFWIEELAAVKGVQYQFTVRRDLSVVKNWKGEIIWRKASAENKQNRQLEKVGD
jgi:hypothetical protein